MKYGSLFTGIGGFDLAFNNAGMEGKWQCEIDRNCKALLGRHFGVKLYDDVRQIKASNTETVDLIAGGFPCQDVSVAGKRAGLAGERSGLWFEFARIIEELKPGWVVIENVPDLLSSNSGRDFAVIVRWLAEFGYGVAWRILDAQFFGVPQRRRRVFIVGHLGDGRATEVLFEREISPWDTAPYRDTREEAPHPFTNRPREDCRESTVVENEAYLLSTADDGRKDRPNGGLYINKTELGNGISSKTDLLIAQTLTSHEAKGGDPSSDNYICLNTRQDPITSEVAQPLNSEDNGQGILWEPRSQDGTPRIHGNISPTLNTADGGQRQPMVGIRRLTLTECERLQGFPDGWTDGQSDSTRYKQLGNAVAVPVIEWIARRIIAVSQGEL